jgi:hypothetical protein
VVVPKDYRSLREEPSIEDRKKLASLMVILLPSCRKGLTRNPDHYPHKTNRDVKPEDIHLNIPLLGPGLKLSNLNRVLELLLFT